ncbi:MAG: HD domain-containing protein [Clostridia bacterium]|nr:HD domain-containing protein [Clostridia bacterium]
MNRLLKLQGMLIDEIDKYGAIVTERDEPLEWEKVHISSCAKIGYIMALFRDVDPDMAACACACHDFGRIVTGKQKGHAEAGYEPVKAFLKKTELFSEEEIEQIAVAVKNHSSKSELGGPIEEIVKDADVLDFDQYGTELPREEQKRRLRRIEGVLADMKKAGFVL